MKEFILLMHTDATESEHEADWEGYIGRLIAEGLFQGGSSMGEGQAFRKHGEPAAPTFQLAGYIKIQAENVEAARACLAGNPTYEAGGTVEIRELVEG